MKRTLLILRHAHAAGERGGADDFDRPLSARGERDAAEAGAELRARGRSPDLILCSPARRTRATAQAVLDALWEPPAAPRPGAVRYEPELYNAPLPVLMRFVRECPEQTGCLLLVGHNPGLDDLLEHLADEPPPRKANGKLMTTAALACLETDAPWSGLGQGGAHLTALLRR